jgi:hydroxymethylbilane synthase
LANAPVSALRIGTRASALARWQANWVASRLAEQGVQVELVPISTRGDREQSEPIRQIAGGDGVFTKELQRALLAGEIDVAVHSLKDLPTLPVEGLELAAVPARGPVGDALVSGKFESLEELPAGARIGTSSLRRQAQLRHVRPDLTLVDVRGNVDTRLRKVCEGEFDALILAEAGLQRLGFAAEIRQVLAKSIMLPAVGQGALGLEARVGDARTLGALAPLDDRASHSAVVAERAMLATIGGGCLAPIGAWGRIETDGRLHLSAVVLSADGSQKLSGAASGHEQTAEELGQRVAADLISKGALPLIEAVRQAEKPGQ